MKLPPTKRDSCGTDAGYQKHYRSGENACPPCLQAHRTKKAKYTERKRQELIVESDAAEQLSRLSSYPIDFITANANCIGRTHLLFPLDGDYSLSRQMCAECPMREPCRTTGVTEILMGETPMGMYGGRTPQELRAEAQPILDAMHRGDEEQEFRLEQILRVAKDLSKSVYGPSNHITKQLREAHLEVESNQQWWSDKK